MKTGRLGNGILRVAFVAYLLATATPLLANPVQVSERPLLPYGIGAGGVFIAGIAVFVGMRFFRSRKPPGE